MYVLGFVDAYGAVHATEYRAYPDKQYHTSAERLQGHTFRWNVIKQEFFNDGNWQLTDDEIVIVMDYLINNKYVVR